jgi:Asp-tRNA(Asn)/Glu-tRNA(Gln) amidotransferase A subunit family amidase
MGSPLWQGFQAGNNARMVDSLLQAGALPVGKTITAEFAVHALNETCNPHDPARTPGTSSSGSAAAVACGMVPFALGTQTAGSIIRPASFCGVWGMKPSFGLLPRTGILKTTDSLDTPGFLAAHGRSLRPLLDATRVKGPNYPPVHRHVDCTMTTQNSPPPTWRVGFVRTPVWSGAETYARDALSTFLATLTRNPEIEVVDIDWPASLHDAHQIHEIIYTKSLAYYFEREARFENHISPIMQSMIAKGTAISNEAFRSALQRQEVLAQEIDRLLAQCDVAISLGTSSSAPPRDSEELPDPSLIWTLAHIPTVAVPLFRCPQGLPFGLQFVARRWQDYRLLNAVERMIELGLLANGSLAIHQTPTLPHRTAASSIEV